MAYITGNLTDVNPGAMFYAALAPALTTAGYTLVDTVVAGARTHKVWKCAAANNSAGLDWYLDVAYQTTGSGNFWLMPMEQYDAATDTATRMVYSSYDAANTTVEQTYYSRHGSLGATLEASQWQLKAGSATQLCVQLTTGSFAYWVSVSGNRVAAMSSVLATNIVYAGMFIPTPQHITAAGAALFPLVAASIGPTGVANQSNGTGATVALTRFPRILSPMAGGWNSSYVNIEPMTPMTNLARLPLGEATTVNQKQVTPLMVTGSNTYSVGGVLGTLDGVAGGGSTAIRGDTLTVDGEAWVAASGASNTGLFMRAA